MKLNFRNKFLKAIKKKSRNFLLFKKKIYQQLLLFKKKFKISTFYFISAFYIILFVVIFLYSHFSKNSHQKKTSPNLTAIQKNPNKKIISETPPLKSENITNNNLGSKTTNKISQKEEILKLLEEVNFQKPAKMIVVIDDFGYSKNKVELFLKITQPITFAVLPNLSDSSAIVNSLHKKNKSILIHLPMEPNDLNQKIEEITLMVSDNEKEIKNKLALSLESSPFSIGISNHMGSKFTNHEESMELLMQYLQKHKLFFLDSKTSSGHLAAKLAKKYQVPYFSRDVFLDNSNDVINGKIW